LVTLACYVRRARIKTHPASTYVCRDFAGPDPNDLEMPTETPHEIRAFLTVDVEHLMLTVELTPR
jgi:hypothetical protein